MKRYFDKKRNTDHDKPVSKKRWIYIVFALIVVLGTFRSCNLFGDNASVIDFYFDNDFPLLEKVATYLLAHESSSVYLESGKIKWMQDGKLVTADADGEIKWLVFRLELRGYKEIAKSENTVYFERWYAPMSNFSGFAFSAE